MALRQNPEQFFITRTQVQTQEPIPVVQSLQTEGLALAIDPNLALVLGLVAMVSILGFFAYLATRK